MSSEAETTPLATGPTQGKLNFRHGQDSGATQLEKVLALLLQGPVCGVTFYERYLPRATARIFELRRAGYVIDRRRCSRPDHRHRSPQYEFELIALPDRLWLGS
jgi:hypothetical protein